MVREEEIKAVVKTRTEILIMNAVIPPGGLKSSRMLNADVRMMKGEIRTRDLIAVRDPPEMNAKIMEMIRRDRRISVWDVRERTAINPKIKVFVAG